MIANHNQFDDVFIAFQYKKWAEANNYEPITPATVGNYTAQKSCEAVITQREGSSAFNEKFIRQVKGLRPQSPLSLVEHDDNNLDFLFADETGYKYNKYVSIVVLIAARNWFSVIHTLMANLRSNGKYIMLISMRCTTSAA
jgi:hypothetical protein